MKRALLAAALLTASCSQTKAPAGLKGTVTFAGNVEPGKVISMDAEEDCQKLHPTPVQEEVIVTGKGGSLSNAFVYIKAGLEGKTFAPAETAVVLEQKGCMFIPRIIGLREGQTLDVKNSDPVSHNIHPNPQNNREWNQQQSPGTPDLQRRFGFPEVMIPVKCNVHAWMRSYIGVLDHPYFAVTPVSGSFEFKDLPPGDYTLATWHEKLGELTQKVTLAPGQSASVDFNYK